MKIELALTKPQEDFVFSEAAFPAIVGGLGSGKSKAGTFRLIMAMLSDKGCNVGYYMPTYDLIRLRAIPGFEEDLATIGIPYTVNRSEYTIKIHGYGEIYLRSYERPERIVSYETAHAITDELDTLDKEKAAFVWRKVVERNRQNRTTPNTIGCVTTPDQGYNGFVYEKWVKKAQKGYQLYKAPTHSNPYLPDGYIEQIRANYDPVLADLYINGEFVSLSENKVYHFFNRKQHHTDRTLSDDDKFIHVSIDFNIGGCCAVVWLIENNYPKAVDEFVSHDTYDFVNNLARYEREGRKILVYPDASGRRGTTNATRSDIGIIEQAGYSVDAPAANPAVRDRINSYNALLAHNQFAINTDTCPNKTHALEVQGYNDKGEPEKFKEHPSIDDWNDSGGYFIHRKFPVTKPALDINVRFR